MDGPQDEQLALRIGALRLARRRGRTRDAAWAAARLRLAGVTLDPVDEKFSRDVRVKFGRALRSARLRRARPLTPNVTVPLVRLTRPNRRRLAAALAAVAVLLGALLLYFRFEEPGGDPEGAPPSAQQAVIVTPQPHLRGRSQPGVAAPVAIVVEATPAPSAATPGPAGAGTGTAGGGTGAGGSGGGTGTGNRTPAPTPAPPTPTPAPTPTIDPSTLMHVRGRVVDSVTRRGMPNVCVAIGILDCRGAPLTDAAGFYAVDLQIGRVLNWGISFIATGYTTQTIRVPARPGTVTVPDIRLRVGP